MVTNSAHQISGDPDGADLMLTRSRPQCPLCDGPGAPLYEGLRDRLFGAAGAWCLKRCQLAACQMLWLDPVPTEEEIGKAYRTYYTHPASATPRRGPVMRLLSPVRRAYIRGRFGYTTEAGLGRYGFLWPLAAALFSVLPGGRDAVDDTVCHLPAPKRGSRLLEVGFGSGQQLARMHALGWHVEGVDMDPVSVEAARAQGFTVHLGELARQAFPRNCFNAVYMSHVIEHVHDPLAVLAECHRILAPGGVLVVVTPNTKSWGHARFGECWMGLDPPRHLSLFSANSLRAAAHRAGFAHVRVRTSARLMAIVWAVSSEIRRKGQLDAREARLPPPGPLIAALTSQVLESMLLTIGRRHDVGEEIVLIARS